MKMIAKLEMTPKHLKKRTQHKTPVHARIQMGRIGGLDRPPPPEKSH